MRGQGRFRRVMRQRLVMAGLAVAMVAAATVAPGQKTGTPDQMGAALRGNVPFTESARPAPLPRWITDDVRRTRSYPDQPPVIPHSIEHYQLSVETNRCLSCHRREYAEAAGAPMISVTHFMTRDGQMLADVSPRRYFCTACHVPQASVQLLVPNRFRDMSAMGGGQAGD